MLYDMVYIDTQIFRYCKPSSGEVAALVANANVSDCTAEVSSWMRSNGL